MIAVNAHTEFAMSAVGNEPPGPGSPVSPTPLVGNQPPGPGSPVSPVPNVGNQPPGAAAPTPPVPNVGNSHAGDAALAASLPTASHSFSADAPLAFAFLTGANASLADGVTVSAPAPQAIAAGVDPNGVADADVRWDFNAAGWVQVTAANLADQDLYSSTHASGVTYWEPIESQPVPTSSYEVAYWFDSASSGDFFV